MLKKATALLASMSMTACGSALAVDDLRSEHVKTFSLTATPSAARGGNTPNFIRPKVYDYAPAVLFDEAADTYRMWWCGGIAGDHILHAEAKKLSGPWHGHDSNVPNSFDDVFKPTRSLDDFDGLHVCDPSVILVEKKYYLYYGGYPMPKSPLVHDTAVGVATSADGLKWDRAHKGALINPARSTVNLPNKYGAGQPSAYYRDRYFHLAFTDTSGAGANRVNGAGIFAWRSKDGTFASGVQEMTRTGWQDLSPSVRGTYSIADAFAVDWAWSHQLQRVFLARMTSKGIAVDIYTGDLKREKAALTVIPGTWHDGPGIVHTAWGRLPERSDKAIPIDIMRGIDDGTGVKGPNGWDLGYVGQNLVMGP